MRSVQPFGGPSPDDRTTRAVIRDEALRLFAERGPQAVTVREIAGAAGVSAGLVLHHFGSKDGLRQQVDQHVLDVLERMLADLVGDGGADGGVDGGADMLDPATGGSSFGEYFARYLPADSPLPGYLRRLLLSDTDAGRQLFRRLFDLSRATLDGLAAVGFAVPGRDPEVRAAVLLANDMAVFLLRDRLTEVLGTDPLSADGMARWAPELLSIYAGGLNATPQGDES